MKHKRQLATATAIFMLCTQPVFNFALADTDDEDAVLLSDEGPLADSAFVSDFDSMPDIDMNDLSDCRASLFEDTTLIDEPEKDPDSTDDHPIYLLDSVDDLIFVREYVRTQPFDKLVNTEYRLTSDIDLGGMEWIPIGLPEEGSDSSAQNLQASAFHGIFDGNGHTISNFKITNTDVTDNDSLRVGFFSTLYMAAVTDLTLTGVDIELAFASDEQASPDTGESSDTEAENAETADTDDTDTAADNVTVPEKIYIGGLCGYSVDACILDCNIDADIKVNEGELSGNNLTAVGLAVGNIGGAIKFDTSSLNAEYAEPRMIENVKTTGSIEAYQTAGEVSDESVEQYFRIGGVIGALLTIDSDINADAVNLESDADITALGAGRTSVGGVIGCSTRTNNSIVNCRYTAVGGDNINIRAAAPDNTRIGGIVGRSLSPMRDCTVSDCNIQAEYAVYIYVGGVVGQQTKSVVENCSSSASLTEKANDLNENVFIGGVVALNGSGGTDAYNDGDVLPVVRSCSFDGGLDCERGTTRTVVAAGFIAGTNYAEGTVTDCTVKKASISVGEQGGALYVGGIVGYDRGGTVERCVNYQDIDVSVTIGNVYVGGIAGACSIGTCYYYTSESTDRVATVYGGKLRDCRSEANVSVITSGNILLGGIVGYHTGQSICSNGQPRIERCCSKGNISGKALKKATVLVGGACGYILDSEAEDSYSECNVTLDLSDEKAASTAFASGFARIKQNASNIETPDSIVRNCYAAGTVSLSENAANAKSGGFASDLSSNYNSKKPDMVVLYPISEGNYYLSEDPEADASIATPLTAESFAKPESFKTIAGENWDFNDTWYMENGRPRLEAEHTSLYRLIYTSENNRNISVDGVIISKPKADSKMYFAAYSASGKLTDIKSVDITADDCINDEFTEIKLENVFDIPVFSSEVKVFLWTDDIYPAAECKTAAFEAE